jgi:hypothetical protein
MEREIISPCIECLCKPLCKNKTYTNLMKCSILYNYVYFRTYPSKETFTHRMKSVLVGLDVDFISHLGYELKY